MASASAVAPVIAGSIPVPGAPIVGRRRMPGGGNAAASVNDGAPILHPGKLPPRLPWPDIGHLAKWSVSSFKFGFGAECLTDEDPDTFWHSDGPQPHFITVEFPRKVSIQKLSMYLSFPMDDSYTPATIAVRAGTGPVDLQDVRILQVEKPDGWITFDVCMEPNEDGDGFKHIEAYILQVIILTNHMNGKDTHVRGLKVLGPVEAKLQVYEEPFPFVSPQFKMYECIR
ncbi:APC10-domain-containing protein [Dichomitus squalens LYAD-421 SS1]|uniref:APC10-domain-containing protein n=1 Tax=Dichomitus squalens (strain LYAD-421) TaxID=732165 RepID=R7SKV0_DICSQ|nr:APC10-domain-containing protein [Dichomitus squalens LYAD-421 SS1]EJF56498.1 APC10-domain-containing protein [Dichomitus squalens LYAD-421 SS1]